MKRQPRIQTFENLLPFEVVQRKSRVSVLVKDSKGEQLAHLTNTGRLPELIYPGSKCLCIPKKPQKTTLRLIGVPITKTKGVLIDPGEQSKCFVNAMERDLIPWLKGWKIKKQEVQFEESRIDFEIESQNKERGFIEVKSAAMLLENKTGSFPDCPTERGQKHVRTMQKIADRKIRSIILFLVQHPDAKTFSPNSEGDPEFARLLKEAAKNGVEVRAIKMHMRLNGDVMLDEFDLPCIV